MRNYLKNRTVQDSVVVLILGVALGIFSVYSFFHSAVKAEWILSPYLFPMLIACFAVVLAYCLFMEGKHQVDKELAEGKKTPGPGPINIKKIAVVVLICFAYYALVSVVTFVPATAIFLACLMYFMGERRLKILIPVAILTPLVLYVIFAMGLNVRLP